MVASRRSESRHVKYSGYLFGEGRRDKNFIIQLIDLEKFKYHTNGWVFSYGSGHGQSPKDVLVACGRSAQSADYHLVVCFIDIDVLKSQYPSTWKQEKEKIEEENRDIHILWQYDNAEDEYRRILKDETMGKRRANTSMRKRMEEVVNTPLWGRILEPIRKREAELKKLDEN